MVLRSAARVRKISHFHRFQSTNYMIVSFIGNGGQPTVAAGTGTSGSGLSVLTSLGDLVASGADALINGPKERRQGTYALSTS